MSPARAAVVIAAAVTLVGSSGCTPRPLPPTSPPPPSADVTPATRPVAPGDGFDHADVNATPPDSTPKVSEPPMPMPMPAEDYSAEAIEKMTREYTRQMLALAEQRKGGQKVDALPPSPVEWGDPDPLQLRPGQPHASVPIMMPPPAPATSDTNSRERVTNVIAVSAPTTLPSRTDTSLANKPVTADDEPAARVVAMVEPPTDERPQPPQNAPPAPADADVRQRAIDSPRDLPAQLDWQLEQFVRGGDVPNLADMAAMSGEDRELLTTLLDGLVEFRNGVRADSNLLLGKKIRPLIDMADRLRARSDLSIPSVVLCSDVYSFGSYLPIAPVKLAEKSARKVVIYCEVENFSSQLGSDKKWATDLTMKSTLYSQDGMEVWSSQETHWGDRVSTRRRDFYIADKQLLPATLTAGRYMLKVTIGDPQTNRVAESVLNVQVVAGEPGGAVVGTSRRSQQAATGTD